MVCHPEYLLKKWLKTSYCTLNFALFWKELGIAKTLMQKWISEYSVSCETLNEIFKTKEI